MLVEVEQVETEQVASQKIVESEKCLVGPRLANWCLPDQTLYTPAAAGMRLRKSATDFSLGRIEISESAYPYKVNPIWATLTP